MATIFPVDAQIDDIFQGYRYNGIAWKIIGISLTEEYVTEENIQQIINDGLIIDGNNI